MAERGTGLDRRALLAQAAAASVAGGYLGLPEFAHAASSRAIGQAPTLTPIVATAAGQVRGYVSGGVNCFRGIRFGASTAPPNRFKAPVKPAPWAGVRDCAVATGGNSAPQALGPSSAPSGPSFRSEAETSEDCLFLNLFTPGLDGRKRPVMVWIHGGGYGVGSGTAPVYDGDNLARHGNVVVVTLNHRLNVLGDIHLATALGPDYADADNLSLLDMALAVEWVRDNAAAFGGDPGNVTLFGQSAGGSKICALMAMPALKGLYHKVIIESGATPNVRTLERAKQDGDRALTLLGLTRANAREILTIPVERFLSMGTIAGGVGGGPVVDGRILPHQPFAPESLALSAHAPLMTGSAATEISLGADEATFNMTEATLRTRMTRWLGDQTDAALQTYKRLHPRASPAELYFLIGSYLRTTRLAVDQAELRLKGEGAPVFVYYFQWRTPVQGGRYITPHTIEIPFVFRNTAKAADLVGTGPELAPITEALSTRWARFAWTGRPERPGHAAWEPYGVETRATMVFDRSEALVHDPLKAERLALAGATRGSLGLMGA